MIKKIVLLFLSAISLYSCKETTSFFTTSDKKEVLLVYNGKELYQSDLAIPKNLSEKDRISYVKNFINHWKYEQLQFEKAAFNLSDTEKDTIEKQVEEYKSDLYVNAYQSKLVAQKIDTLIQEKELKDYYKKHIKNFRNHTNIVQYRYVKVNREELDSIPEIWKKSKKLFFSNNYDDLDNFFNQNYKYILDRFISDSVWVNFDKLAHKLPLKFIKNQESFIRNNKRIELSDSTNYYCIKINNALYKGNVKPFTFVKKDIRNLILNQRKVKIIQQIENEMLNEVKIK